MPDYFTEGHFDLLNRWQGQKRDKSNREQNAAYDDLKEAYSITDAWAREVQSNLFPSGKVETRQRPTSQANLFLVYNWARIYPNKDSPKYLAYTVGIDGGYGFVVKIDTVPPVRFHENDTVRRAYLSLRGNLDNSSPIVAVLPREEGLKKTLQDLVAWTVQAINDFKFRYDEVADRLKPFADQ